MAVGGILSGFCFATIGPLAKKFDERVLLLFAGIVPMILGTIYNWRRPTVVALNKYTLTT